jgi:hypothetical protein
MHLKYVIQILSEVIRASSLQNASLPSDKTASRKAVEVVSHWRRVLFSVVSAMVPTSALLRFALNDAKGRSPHPLCNDLPESALSSETMVTSRFSTKNEVGVNINRVGFLIDFLLFNWTSTYCSLVSLILLDHSHWPFSLVFVHFLLKTIYCVEHVRQLLIT